MPEQVIEQTVELPVIRDVMTLMGCHCDDHKHIENIWVLYMIGGLTNGTNKYEPLLQLNKKVQCLIS